MSTEDNPNIYAALDEQFAAADYHEAADIAEERARLIEEDHLPAGLGWSAAIAVIDTNRQDLVPGGTAVGYETAKKAMRWWNRQKMYLDSLEEPYARFDSAGERPANHRLDNWVYGSYAEKMAHDRAQHIYMGSQIIAGNPHYARTMAALEAAQMKSGMDSLGDPIEAERIAAFHTLRGVMDRLADQDIYGPMNEKIYVQHADGPQSKVIRSLRRNILSDGSASYAIYEYPNNVEDIPEQQELSPEHTLMLVFERDVLVATEFEHTYGDEGETEEAIYVDTYRALELATNLAPPPL